VFDAATIMNQSRSSDGFETSKVVPYSYSYGTHHTFTSLYLKPEIQSMDNRALD